MKILRPRIDRKVARDLATFRVIARWIEKLMPTARRLRPVDAIDTLARSLEAETDLRREAAAAAEVALLYVTNALRHPNDPRVYRVRTSNQ